MVKPDVVVKVKDHDNFNQHQDMDKEVVNGIVIYRYDNHSIFSNLILDSGKMIKIKSIIRRKTEQNGYGSNSLFRIVKSFTYF